MGVKLWCLANIRKYVEKASQSGLFLSAGVIIESQAPSTCIFLMISSASLGFFDIQGEFKHNIFPKMVQPIWFRQQQVVFGLEAF